MLIAKIFFIVYHSFEVFWFCPLQIFRFLYSNTLSFLFFFLYPNTYEILCFIMIIETKPFNTNQWTQRMTSFLKIRQEAYKVMRTNWNSLMFSLKDLVILKFKEKISCKIFFSLHITINIFLIYRTILNNSKCEHLQEEEKGDNTVAIVLGVIGGLTGLGLVIMCVCFCCCKGRCNGGSGSSSSHHHDHSFFGFSSSGGGGGGGGGFFSGDSGGGGDF